MKLGSISHPIKKKKVDLHSSDLSLLIYNLAVEDFEALEIKIDEEKLEELLAKIDYERSGFEYKEWALVPSYEQKRYVLEAKSIIAALPDLLELRNGE